MGKTELKARSWRVPVLLTRLFRKGIGPIAA